MQRLEGNLVACDVDCGKSWGGLANRWRGLCTVDIDLADLATTRRGVILAEQALAKARTGDDPCARQNK